MNNYRNPIGYNTCKNKKRFKNNLDANIRLTQIKLDDPTCKLIIYKCDICDGYHFTSMSNLDRVKAKKKYTKIKKHIKNKRDYNRQIEAEYWENKLK